MAETIIERLKRLRTETIDKFRSELTKEQLKFVDEGCLQELVNMIENNESLLISGKTEDHLLSSISQREVDILAILVKETLQKYFTVEITDPDPGKYDRRGVYRKVLIISGW